MKESSANQQDKCEWMRLMWENLYKNMKERNYEGISLNLNI